MNSIFSSFDALCAEFLGQAFRPFFASSSTHKHDGISRLVSEPDMKKNQQANVDKKPRAAAPRFAPELDGLHCFETLVSH
ncbi:Detected protein of unknown function [Hibiscus syriacus]|uniref:Uncharacterized protein n=1 Tax=Hibiscus syriacus TaxID=106335 RepID=A0A6A2Y1A0_HIBSY|nr:Detected protein of unknown function [Hibiscus syriacus]